MDGIRQARHIENIYLVVDWCEPLDLHGAIKPKIFALLTALLL